MMPFSLCYSRCMGFILAGLIVVGLAFLGYLALAAISVLRNYDDIEWGDDDYL